MIKIIVAVAGIGVAQNVIIAIFVQESVSAESCKNRTGSSTPH